MSLERIACRTPNADGITNIPVWKFDVIRVAIINAITDAGQDGLLFSELTGEVRKRLSASELKDLGSVGWHTTTVKLELEGRGEIDRVAGKSPQRLFLVGKQ